MDEGRARRRGVSPRLWLAGGWLLLALLAAIFAPLVAPQDPLAQDLMLERLPPFWLDGAEPGYWLGTDSLGLVGSTLGLIAGYFGGWADRIISRIVDIWMAFPPVLFAILLVAVLGTGLSSVILAIAIIDWTRFCRVIRAEAMGQSRMDYVENARIAGYGRIGIMLREVLPNVVPSIVALLSLEMGIAVIVEAILSFVNLSISTDDPTWGGIIAEGRLSIHQAWWVLVFPLITLILTVLSFSQFGEALKTRFDPVLR
ncbi:ABC transporter permease (plasmid) [Mesorhizobium loti NZP2037]|nr:ABC transporter permease [Mesorhizobium loti]ANN61959.1 ABC transporter permease [Mesorhizobium loti NZP2037]